MRDVGVDDVIRTLILMLGFALALVCVKFGWLAVRNGESYRAWGLVSYGLLVITPAIIGLYRYGDPLIVPATATYVVGMLCGVVALRSTYTVNAEWANLRRKETARGDRDHHG